MTFVWKKHKYFSEPVLIHKNVQKWTSLYICCFEHFVDQKWITKGQKRRILLKISIKFVLNFYKKKRLQKTYFDNINMILFESISHWYAILEQTKFCSTNTLPNVTHTLFLVHESLPKIRMLDAYCWKLVSHLCWI